MNLLNRIVHLLRPARTTTLPVETGNIAMVQVNHNPFETRTLQVLQHVGFASSLPLNTDVMTGQVGGDNSNGVVLGTNNQQFRPKNMVAGEAMMYDCGTTQQSVYLKSDGSIVLMGFHKIIASCDTEIDITAPTVKITGNLQVTGSVTAGFGGGDSVTLQGHIHDDSHGDTISAPVAGT